MRKVKMDSTMMHEGTGAAVNGAVFFSDASAMTPCPLPTAACTISESSHTIGVSESDILLYGEPPYDPNAEYSLPSTKRCFNCMSTSGMLITLPSLVPIMALDADLLPLYDFTEPKSDSGR
ncbi:hypothetical protein BDV93DRAFT_610249 [Ceratobasidium sp. AG-I]|nr:hypothetical protein BDV93DRAFT_610249 [Ceratobasidium sp. AG-I]